VFLEKASEVFSIKFTNYTGNYNLTFVDLPKVYNNRRFLNIEKEKFDNYSVSQMQARLELDQNFKNQTVIISAKPNLVLDKYQNTLV
jgi:hypothetical protein